MQDFTTRYKNPPLRDEGHHTPATTLTGHRKIWNQPRSLNCPRIGFYIMRLARNRPWVPAVIYQVCPMVVPQPGVVGGPHPDDWCRPLDRSPIFRAQINCAPAATDRLWTARSLRPVSAMEYAFRIGPLRQWERSQAKMARRRRLRHHNALADLPPLF